MVVGGTFPVVSNSESGIPRLVAVLCVTDLELKHPHSLDFQSTNINTQSIVCVNGLHNYRDAMLSALAHANAARLYLRRGRKRSAGVRVLVNMAVLPDGGATKAGADSTPVFGQRA